MNDYALEPALAKKLRIPLERWGANHTSRYNWLVDSSNSGGDFFFVVGGESVCRIGFNRLVEKGVETIKHRPSKQYISAFARAFFLDRHDTCGRVPATPIQSHN